MKKISVIGAGGFGREVFHHLIYDGYVAELYDDGDNDYSQSTEIDFKNDLVLVAIGDPKIRKKVVDNLPKETNYHTYISSKAIILDKNIKIGTGSIICAGVVITTNVIIGDHCQLNPNTSIAHDCVIGNFFTATPGVKISGNCIIGNLVYIGTNSSIKQKIKITDNVIIGLNSGVTKNILEDGTYIGTPIKKIY